MTEPAGDEDASGLATGACREAGSHPSAQGHTLVSRPARRDGSNAAISRRFLTSRCPSATTGWFQVRPSSTGTLASSSCRASVANTSTTSPPSVRTMTCSPASRVSPRVACGPAAPRRCRAVWRVPVCGRVGPPRRRVYHDRRPARHYGPGRDPPRTDGRCPAHAAPPARDCEPVPGHRGRARLLWKPGNGKEQKDLVADEAGAKRVRSTRFAPVSRAHTAGRGPRHPAGHADPAHPEVVRRGDRDTARWPVTLPGRPR